MRPADPTILFQDQVLTTDEANYILSLSWTGWYTWIEISRTFNICWRHNTTPEDIRAWCRARRREFSFSCRQFISSNMLHDWYKRFYADIEKRADFHRRIHFPDANMPSVSFYLAKCWDKAVLLCWHIQSLPGYLGPPPQASFLGERRMDRKVAEYEKSGLWALAHWQGRGAYIRHFGCIGQHFPFVYAGGRNPIVVRYAKKEDEDVMYAAPDYGGSRRG